MAAGGRESSSIAKKKIKRNLKKKREEESNAWKHFYTNRRTFSTLFAGSDELEGGFLSLEEINEADYKLTALPTTDSAKTEKGSKSNIQARENNDGNKEAVDEIIIGRQDKEDEKEAGQEADGEIEEDGQIEGGEESKCNDNLESQRKREKKAIKNKKEYSSKKNKAMETEKNKAMQR